MKVLILVDLQNGFCPGGELAVAGGDEVIGVANALIASGVFDKVVATKDWHPADHLCFASNHPGKSPLEIIDLKGTPQILWPVHCVQNSRSAELHPALNRAGIDLIIHKGTDPEVDSYSAFFDNNAQRETPLRAALQAWADEAGIPVTEIELTIGGLATDYCVGLTAKDGRKLGFPVDLVVDGCRAVNLRPGDDVRTLRELSVLGVNIVESRTITLERVKNRPLAVGI